MPLPHLLSLTPPSPTIVPQGIELEKSLSVLSLPEPAPDSPEAAGCRAEARASVNTREAARQLNFNNPNQMDRVRQMEADAESRAFTDCMRRLGLIRGGGVEPVRRPGMGF